MSVWNVEVIEPVRHAKLTSVERLRFDSKTKRMEDAGWKSEDYRQKSRSAATEKEAHVFLTRSYEWADRFSERRAELLTYVKELDAKYAT
jgi:hypothetical protein